MLPFIIKDRTIIPNKGCFLKWGEIVKKEIPRIFDIDTLATQTNDCGMKWSITSSPCLFTWIYQWLVTLRINENPNSDTIKVRELGKLNSNTPHRSVIKGLEEKFKEEEEEERFYDIGDDELEYVFDNKLFYTAWSESVKKHLEIKLPSQYNALITNLKSTLETDHVYNEVEFVMHTYLWNDLNPIYWPAEIKDVNQNGKYAVYDLAYIGREGDGSSDVPHFELKELTEEVYKNWLNPHVSSEGWKSLKNSTETELVEYTGKAKEIIDKKLKAQSYSHIPGNTMDLSFGRSIPRKSMARKRSSNKGMVSKVKPPRKNKV